MEIFASEMDKEMQENVVKIVREAIESFEDISGIETLIQTTLTLKYFGRWHAVIDPEKRNSPEHPWNYMIYFRLGDHRFLISDRKKNFTNYFLCCL